jgi:hypothetical protein
MKIEETLLLTIKVAGQAGDDVLISPSLPADQYYFTDVEKIRIITPDSHVLEKDAEFSIPLGTPSHIYLLLILNTQKDEIPVGSQIWIKKSLEQITRKPDTTEE